MTETTALRCGRCDVIIYVDLFGEGIDDAELARKIAAHQSKCATPEDLLAATTPERHACICGQVFPSRDKRKKHYPHCDEEAVIDREQRA